MGARKIKFEILQGIFVNWLEPLDIIDLFDGTRIFDTDGMNIRGVKGSDDQARRTRVELFVESLEGSCTDGLDSSVGIVQVVQELIVVLKKVKQYEWLVPLLEDEPFTTDFFECFRRMQKIDELKDILGPLMPALEGIDAIEVAEYMLRHFLNENEREEIGNLARTKSNSNAVCSLLHKLIYKQPTWVDHFIETIRMLGYGGSRTGLCENQTLLELLQDYCGCFNLEEAMGELVIVEDAEQLSKSSSYVPSNRNIDSSGTKTKQNEFQLPTESIPSSSEYKEAPQVLRKYQEELCKIALQGENVVICAPTNSGKTTVAASIIAEHLTKETDAKVLFFTPTGGLAEQQFRKLKWYFINHREKISLLHGGIDKDDKGFDRDDCKKIYSHDVIVMTPQILLNCIEKKKVHSICDFTLLVFDECHHTRMLHPYCEIMKKVLQNFATPRPQRNIQIVGLTATLGIGDAENEDDAEKYIYAILGMMNATGGLAMVTDPKNMDELNDHCLPAPEETIYIEHGEDLFQTRLLEGGAKIVNSLTAIEVSRLQMSSPKGSYKIFYPKFRRWCRKVRYAAEHHNGDGADTLGRDAKSCAECLLMLIDVQRMKENCHPKYAYTQLEKFADERFADHIQKNTQMENKLYAILLDVMKELQNCVEAENKMLDVITEAIERKNQEDSEFRCMVMLSRRSYAECFKKYINTTPVLGGLGCEMCIGVGRKSGSDTPGMTYKERAETIKAFNEGKFKVLVCTPDAVGEGLDIPNCNMVITVECVKKDIVEVQLKGRARKPNSEVLHIHFGQPDPRDSLPAKKEILMKKVTEKIHKLCNQNLPAYKKKLTEGRINALKEIEESRKRKATTKPKLHTNVDTLLCRHCSTPICCVSNIVKINGNHHTIDYKNFQAMYETKKHKKIGEELSNTGMTYVNKICCVECPQDWGNEVEWKGRLIPILGVKGFKIKDREGKLHSPSQWGRTGLNIASVKATEEVEQFLEKFPRRTEDLKSYADQEDEAKKKVSARIWNDVEKTACSREFNNDTQRKSGIHKMNIGYRRDSDERTCRTGKAQDPDSGVSEVDLIPSDSEDSHDKQVELIDPQQGESNSFHASDEDDSMSYPLIPCLEEEVKQIHAQCEEAPAWETFKVEVKSVTVHEDYPFDEVSEDVGPEGATIKIGGCSVTFPPSCFEQTQLVTVSASINPKIWPQGKVGITPTLNIKAHDLKAPAIVKLKTWCVNDDCNGDLPVEVLHFDKDRKDWNIVHRYQLGRSREIEFQISHFSGILATLWNYLFPSYVLYPVVCFYRDQFAIATVLDDDLAKDECIKRIKTEIGVGMTPHSYSTFNCKHSSSIRSRIFSEKHKNDFTFTPPEVEHTVERVVQGQGSFISYPMLESKREPTKVVLSFQLFKDKTKWHDNAFKYFWGPDDQIPQTSEQTKSSPPKTLAQHINVHGDMHMHSDNRKTTGTENHGVIISRKEGGSEVIKSGPE